LLFGTFVRLLWEPGFPLSIDFKRKTFYDLSGDDDQCFLLSRGGAERYGFAEVDPALPKKDEWRLNPDNAKAFVVLMTLMGNKIKDRPNEAYMPSKMEFKALLDIMKEGTSDWRGLPLVQKQIDVKGDVKDVKGHTIVFVKKPVDTNDSPGDIIEAENAPQDADAQLWINRFIALARPAPAQ